MRARTLITACGLLAVLIGGCSTTHKPPRYTVRAQEAAVRHYVAFYTPFARQALAACRTGEIGCAANDMEYWISDWSGGGPLEYAAGQRNIGVVGYFYVLASQTSRQRVTFVGPLTSTTALVARVAQRGPVTFTRERCSCIDIAP